MINKTTILINEAIKSETAAFQYEKIYDEELLDKEEGVQTKIFVFKFTNKIKKENLERALVAIKMVINHYIHTELRKEGLSNRKPIFRFYICGLETLEDIHSFSTLMRGLVLFKLEWKEVE